MPGTGSNSSVAPSTSTTGSYRRPGIPVKSHRRNKQQMKSSSQPVPAARSALDRNLYASELSKSASSHSSTYDTRKKGAARAAAVEKTKHDDDDDGGSSTSGSIKEAFINLVNKEISDIL
jgi:hypothetical protein